MSNAPLKEFVDLSANEVLEHLIASKKAMKVRVEALLTEQKQIDSQIKEIIGDYQSFACNGLTGTYRYEPRESYVVKASSPRVLRIS